VLSGACLSGGLDSSSIVSVMDKYHTRPEAFSTVSSLIPHTRYNEEEYVQAVLADTGHVSHRVHPDIHELIDRDLMDKIVYHQDQPILTASFFSEYKVFQTAAENRIKVMLSGQRQMSTCWLRLFYRFSPEEPASQRPTFQIFEPPGIIHQTRAGI
jgi:asparagine synthase (glutamine-hydrolysing)